MQVKPKQFYCDLQNDEEIVFHVPEKQGEFLKKSLFFTGMWAVDIQWGGANNTPKIYPKIVVGLLKTTKANLEYIKLGLKTRCLSDTPNIAISVELVVHRIPCWIVQGCLVMYQFGEEVVYEMRRELLTKETAWEFCRNYSDTRIVQVDDLTNLAIEIWQQQGHAVI